MKSSIRVVGATLFAAVSLALFGAAPASATTFCVPVFHAACPNVPGNQAQADLQTAMAVLGNDGIPDKIIINEGQLTHTGSIYPLPFFYANDPLEVVGAGVDKTSIKVTGNNIYAMDLTDVNFRQRKVTLKGMTFIAPSGLSQALAQVADDVFDGVNFVSEDATNVGGGSEGVRVIDGATFNNVKFSGVSGGTFSRPITTGSTSSGQTLNLTGTEIRDSGTAIVADLGTTMPVSIHNSHFAVDGQVLNVNDGEQSLIENSIIESKLYIPLYVTSNNAQSSTLILRNDTIQNQGTASSAVSVSVIPGNAGSASAVVTDSIIRGFPNAWAVEAPVSAAFGDANLNVSYSNVSSTGIKIGDGTLTSTPGVINQDPLFKSATDFHLNTGSPSIDAGNPAAGGLLTDLEGTVRPLDGNGDGIAVRDQGAYEAPAVAVPDTTGPTVSKVKFKSPKGKKKGSLKFTLSEPARVTATFKPVPRGKGKKKRKTVKLTKSGKAGANTLKIGRKKLKKGKYRLTIKSADDSGNPGNPVVRKVKVKA